MTVAVRERPILMHARSVRSPETTMLEGNLSSPMWLVGRDHGEAEARQRRHFVGAAGMLLNSILRAGGIERDNCCVTNVVCKQPPRNDWKAHRVEDVTEGVTNLWNAIKRHKPKLVVAFGNEAFRATMGQHPDDGGELPSITDARGYLFDSPLGCRIIAMVHPAATLREWVPWHPLTVWDIRKAKRELEAGCPPLPERIIHVVHTEDDGQRLLALLDNVRRVAVDIENDAAFRLRCLGVAATVGEAFVVPDDGDGWRRGLIRRVCEHPVGKVLQNGAYDRYFLHRFCGIALRHHTFDTMLGWHSLFPELAGAKEDTASRRMRRKTQKALRALASLYSRERYWKDYDFATDDERYTLNGIDCCVTLEVAEQQMVQLEAA